MVLYGLTVSSMKEWTTKGISDPPRKAQINQGRLPGLFVTNCDQYSSSLKILFNIDYQWIKDFNAYLDKQTSLSLVL